MLERLNILTILTYKCDRIHLSGKNIAEDRSAYTGVHDMS